MPSRARRSRLPRSVVAVAVAVAAPAGATALAQGSAPWVPRPPVLTSPSGATAAQSHTQRPVAGGHARAAAVSHALKGHRIPGGGARPGKPGAGSPGLGSRCPCRAGETTRALGRVSADVTSRRGEGWGAGMEAGLHARKWPVFGPLRPSNWSSTPARVPTLEGVPPRAPAAGRRPTTHTADQRLPSADGQRLRAADRLPCRGDRRAACSRSLCPAPTPQSGPQPREDREASDAAAVRRSPIPL